MPMPSKTIQCYAKGLHETCVMVTLNDLSIFDFERFLDAYSHTIWPLFVMAHASMCVVAG